MEPNGKEGRREGENERGTGPLNMDMMPTSEVAMPLLEIELDANTILRVNNTNPAQRPDSGKIPKGKAHSR